MKKKQSSRSSSSSSSKTRVRVDFKPNMVIYEKTNINQNTKNTIKLDIKPQGINDPTIESILKVNERKSE